MKCHMPEEETPVVNGNMQMNLYDMNKQIISQMPSLNADGIEQATAVVSDYVADTKNTFYMLLCRDINYYTLFHMVDYITEPTVACEVLNCALDIGIIKSVETTGDGAIEIWVEPTGEGSEPVAMYLFGYDGGVIECAL